MRCVDFHVRKSEIDYNNHVNNAKYLIGCLKQYLLK